MKSIVIAALLGHTAAAPTCTKAQVDDTGNADRVKACSTLTACYDEGTGLYANGSCAEDW
jgi:hypothetical protein